MVKQRKLFWWSVEEMEKKGLHKMATDIRATGDEGMLAREYVGPFGVKLLGRTTLAGAIRYAQKEKRELSKW